MSLEPDIHLLKERNGKEATAKCGEKVTLVETTAWWIDVTCQECLALMDEGGG